MKAHGATERAARVAEAVRELGADWAVLTQPDADAYATGHVVPIEAGPSPFAGGPTTAFVGRDGAVGLVAANVEPNIPTGLDVVKSYIGFGWAEPNDVEAAYMAAVGRVCGALGVGGVLAVEPTSFTAALAGHLAPQRTVPITAALIRARRVKTPGEIPLLTQAARTAAIGQEAALAESRAGRSELDAFARIRAAMERFAGERLPVAGDYLSGVERTARTAGWPVERSIARGDPIICDLAPRVGGYWGDSCGSFVVGEPSDAYLRLFAASREALDLALSIVRPGLAIDELDRRLRAVVARHGYAYPHHSGHSIGTAVHEHPRIVPHETDVLESGMVMLLEPSAYHPEVGGVRLEWMVVVEANGCRPLAPFEQRKCVDN